MADPRPDGKQKPVPEGTRRGAGRPLRLPVTLTLVAAVAVLAGLVGSGLVRIQGDSRVSPSASSPAPSASSPLARIAVVDASGALATMDERGGSVVSYAMPGIAFGFPAWSPDGSRIAAVGRGADDSGIYVFTVRPGGPGHDGEPVVIYRSPDRRPFYLYWTPDGRQLTFLTTEPDGLALRIAPADVSAPADGSGPAGIIRRGAPLYFDWVDASRLLVHIGDGPDAFLGEVGLDGASVRPAVSGTGLFRSASVTRDGRYLAYVRSEGDSSGEIVIEPRDGSHGRQVPVFGPAAMLFDPTGDTLASIAADKPVGEGAVFPIGPLRLIDVGSGSLRTVLDGSVVAFFWAPDGRTIAALRLSRSGDDQVAAAGSVVLAAATIPHGPAAGSARAEGVVLRLAFVDVSTGSIRSERDVRLSDTFVNLVLPYFDQYALSHRLWSPDGANIVLPLVDENGATQLVVVPADGSDSRPIADGAMGFWSP